MADSKKKVKQVKFPDGKSIRQGGDPKQYYSQHPAWNFSGCDKEKWSIYSDAVYEIFRSEILPHFESWESQTWIYILVDAKKQNHSVDLHNLNKVALSRLTKMRVEAEALISLRLSGRHRIYGYMSGAIFNILWIDLDHGDNTTCVCRSTKKHT